MPPSGIASRGLDAPEGRSEHGDQLDLFADRAAEEGDRLFDERVEVDRAQLEGLAASEGEQLSRECRRHLRGLFDLAETFRGAAIRLDLAARDTGIAEDAHQQIVEVVCDAGRELAYGVHLLRLSQLALGLLPIRDVLDHRRHRGRLAVGVALEHRGELAPNELPVLTHVALLVSVGARLPAHQLVVQDRVDAPVVGVRDLAGRELLELRRRVAEQPLECGIRLEHTRFRVDASDPDRGAVDHRTKAGERLDLQPLRLELAGVLIAAESTTESSSIVRRSSNMSTRVPTICSTPMGVSP